MPRYMDVSERFPPGMGAILSLETPLVCSVARTKETDYLITEDSDGVWRAREEDTGKVVAEGTDIHDVFDRLSRIGRRPDGGSEPHLPTHLAACSEALTTESPGEAHGSLRCPCGGVSFEILHHDRGREEGARGPVATVSGDVHEFVIAARCVRCAMSHLIFDARVHGYDALLGDAPGKRPESRPAMETWTCLKCGGRTHRATFAVQLPDETEIQAMLEEERGGPPKPDTWYDAFFWFSMGVTCEACGLETPDFVEYECA